VKVNFLYTAKTLKLSDGCHLDLIWLALGLKHDEYLDYMECIEFGVWWTVKDRNTN